MPPPPSSQPSQHSPASPQDRVARRVRVHGRVQGVFFRDSCRTEAVTRGVTGWVRNDPEGSVTAHLEGSPGAVDALVSWCRTGPPRAHVDGVDVIPTEPTGATAFDVVG